MNLTQRPDPGTVVYLRPNTKTAGAACRAHLPARVVSYDQWPLVEVEVEKEGWQPRHVVHCNDIGLNPAAKKRGNGGDMAGGERLRIPKPLYAKPKPLDLPPGWDEQSLF